MKTNTAVVVMLVMSRVTVHPRALRRVEGGTGEGDGWRWGGGVHTSFNACHDNWPASVSFKNVRCAPPYIYPWFI